MNLFGNEPQEQAMQSLIHDTNSGLASIDWYAQKLSDWARETAKQMAELGIKNSSVPFVVVEYLKRDSKRIKNAIDNYYKKFENDFKQ